MNMKDVQGSVVRGAEVMMALQARVCPAHQAGPLVCCTGVNSHASAHVEPACG